VNNKRCVKPKIDHRVYEYHIPGKTTLTPGVEVSIVGRKGRYRFQYAQPPLPTDPPNKPTVLTFVGGPLNGQGEKFVSAYPDRVTRVHRKHKTLNNIQKEKKRGN
jgi:hypothetical protein